MIDESRFLICGTRPVRGVLLSATPEVDIIEQKTGLRFPARPVKLILDQDNRRMLKKCHPDLYGRYVPFFDGSTEAFYDREYNLSIRFPIEDSLRAHLVDLHESAHALVAMIQYNLFSYHLEKIPFKRWLEKLTFSDDLPQFFSEAVHLGYSCLTVEEERMFIRGAVNEGFADWCMVYCDALDLSLSVSEWEKYYQSYIKLRLGSILEDPSMFMYAAGLRYVKSKMDMFRSQGKSTAQSLVAVLRLPPSSLAEVLLT